MRRTIVFGLTDGDDGHAALELGVGLSQRLGLRLVLAHLAEGLAQLDGYVGRRRRAAAASAAR